MAIMLVWQLFSCYYYQVDDTYIFLRYADHLLERRFFVYNPSEGPSYGTTSILWTLLMAGFRSIVKEHFIAVVALKVLFCVLAHAVFLWFVFEVISNTLGRLCALVIWFAAANIQRWMASGFETPLYALLFVSVCLLLYKCAQDPRRIRYFFFLGILGAFLGLTRPEGLFAVFAVGLCTLSFVRKLGPAAFAKRGIVFLVPVFLLYGTWLCLCLRFFGTITPNTVLAKGALGPAFHHWFRNLSQGIQSLMFFAFSELLASVLLFAMAVALSFRRPRQSPLPRQMVVLVCFCTAYFVTYVLVYLWQNGSLGNSRYVANLEISLITLVPVLIELIRGKSKFLTMVSGACVLACLLFVVIFYHPRVKAEMERYRTLRDVALRYSKQLSKGDYCMLGDVGVPGYYLGCNVIDYKGLVTPYTLKFLNRSEELLRLAADRHAKYLMAFDYEAHQFLRVPSGKSLSLIEEHVLGAVKTPLVDYLGRPPAKWQIYSFRCPE